MEAGQFATLKEVLQQYNTAPQAPLGHSELKPFKLAKTQLEQIISFLKTLSAPLNVDPKWLAKTENSK
jgi:cytochrome c peroxidase